jgi:HK97 family phage prohead protease
MNLKRRTFAFETKEVKDTGEFTGYASVFDVLDTYRDVVKPGAFAATLANWKAKDKLPPILWQHDSRIPLGPHLEMAEDGHGLFVRGKLLVNEIEKAREAHALLKNGVISGMSIGFDIAEDGMEYDGKTNVWNLTKVNLWENSLVTFPANAEAQVEEVKSALELGKLPTPSQFERILRDVGFSTRQAKYITSRGFTGLRDAGSPLRDGEDNDDTKSIAAELAALSTYFERIRT